MMTSRKDLLHIVRVIFQEARTFRNRLFTGSRLWTPESGSGGLFVERWQLAQHRVIRAPVATLPLLFPVSQFLIMGFWVVVLFSVYPRHILFDGV